MVSTGMSGMTTKENPSVEFARVLPTPELIEQLETFGSIGDLLDDMIGDADDDEDDPGWDTIDGDLPETRSNEGNALEEGSDDEEPRVLKFPGTE